MGSVVGMTHTPVGLILSNRIDHAGLSLTLQEGLYYILKKCMRILDYFFFCGYVVAEDCMVRLVCPSTHADSAAAGPRSSSSLTSCCSTERAAGLTFHHLSLVCHVNVCMPDV